MAPTEPPVDVFIPAHPKDFPVLPLCIKALRRYARPRPANITVVCGVPEEELRRVVPRQAAGWLHEGAVGDLFARDQMRRFVTEAGDRTGWYYQQLVKYALRKHSATTRYLVMDADTVLIRPTPFVRDGRSVFHRATQYRLPYFHTYEKLLGYLPERQASFIRDYMVLDVDLVDDLLAVISVRAGGANWYDAIVDAIDPLESSSFSEFETYGYYLSRFHPERFVSMDSPYVMQPRTRLGWAWLDSREARRAGAFSISYHHYLVAPPRVGMTAKAMGFAQRLGNGLKRRGWGSSYLGRRAIDALLWPNDALTAWRGYRRSFGASPRLLRPQTFNEIVQHNKLFRRRRLHTTLADKIAVRAYVSERVGADVLTKLYWTGTDLTSVPKEALPTKFVIKANHASGTNLIVQDRDSLDWIRAAQTAREWLQTDYSTYCGEWQYRWIEPVLFIEELLTDAYGEIPRDYKFFCIHGRIACVQVDVDRFKHHTRAFVDRNFERMNLGLIYPRYTGPLARPACFASMLQIAEALAVDEPFIRVDLYDVGRVVFGEITLHPAAGTGKFDPESYDYDLGHLLRHSEPIRNARKHGRDGAV
ncbi:MAG: hypothetical protein JWM02_3650 [Frankiales bacterium]|nr:hypothetical protein [Frankiales bacterium]